MKQMGHPVFNPGNVKFSLAQLAKEEEARKSGRNKNPYTAGRTEKELQKDREDQDKAREAVRKLPTNYVNPQFAEKERFKANDSTEKQLGGFRPGTQLYSSQRTELSESQKSNIKANRNNPLTIVKPLRPNILDAAADDREKELAEQRKSTGLKWVTVNQR